MIVACSVSEKGRTSKVETYSCKRRGIVHALFKNIAHQRSFLDLGQVSESGYKLSSGNKVRRVRTCSARQQTQRSSE